MIRSFVLFVALSIAVLLASPLLLIAAAAWCVAALVNGFGRIFDGRGSAFDWRELVEYAPVVGWKPRANVEVTALADHAFRITTGADGWRGTTDFASADMVVFGDSFAFGHGCDDRAMYTNHTGRVTVKPIGADGYQMVHGLLWMQSLAEQLRGKIVVWFVYYGNDLHESLMPSVGPYRMPHVRPRGKDRWEVVTDHVSPSPWTFPHSDDYSGFIADFSTPGSYSDRVFSACDWLISQAQATCRSVDAELVVCGVPDLYQLIPKKHEAFRQQSPNPERFDIDLPNKRFAEVCSRRHIRFVPLSDHLTPADYLAADIHWTTSGHRKVGKVLEELFLQRAVATAEPVEVDQQQGVG